MTKTVEVHTSAWISKATFLKLTLRHWKTNVQGKLLLDSQNEMCVGINIIANQQV